MTTRTIPIKQLHRESETLARLSREDRALLEEDFEVGALILYAANPPRSRVLVIDEEIDVDDPDSMAPYYAEAAELIDQGIHVVVILGPTSARADDWQNRPPRAVQPRDGGDKRSSVREKGKGK